MGLVRFFPGQLLPSLPWPNLPSEDGLHLVAFGEGAGEALRAAFKAEVRSLVLISPLVKPHPLLRARLRALLFGLDRGGVEGFLALARGLLVGERGLGGGVLEALAPLWTEEGLRAWLQGLLALEDQRRWLRGTEARVLVLQGAEDALSLLPLGREVADWAKGEALQWVIPGAGYLLPWEAGEEVEEHLRDFLLGEGFN